MGLTHSSTGINAVDNGFKISRKKETDRIVALAGNPNVGKSTVFNGLTGLHQHTGNWPGKTVANAVGYVRSRPNGYVIVDIPGTYSLRARSKEEEIARNFICFGNTDCVVVVCDATCLERNLNLVLQVLETGKSTVVCLNLIDEAEKKGIFIDVPKLEKMLGTRVVTTVARKKKSLCTLLEALAAATGEEKTPTEIFYEPPIEAAIKSVMRAIPEKFERLLDARWLAIQLLDMQGSLKDELNAYLGCDILSVPPVKVAVDEALCLLTDCGITRERLTESIASSTLLKAKEIFAECTARKNGGYSTFDRRVDAFLTSRMWGYPAMLALLMIVFYLTICAANYPSQWLEAAFSYAEGLLERLFSVLSFPAIAVDFLLNGIWRVLSTVVSVMLPPMAIFFPLFTLLEDSGYLPRIAYNLDKPFRRCQSCGKQALTMCMGFGCNAAGIVGCRIIDSPRERLLAILTNSFVPCNGRFPMLISLICMFFVTGETLFSKAAQAACLTGIICFSIAATFVVTHILSLTVLRGEPSEFILEMPSYRKPQIMRVLVRSVFDRTLFVLGRAVAVAVPAGMIIWLMSNLVIGGGSLLAHICAFLDPFARLCGLDGEILAAFVLGFPANETVMPIVAMAYASRGSIAEITVSEMKHLFLSNGWSRTTALCTMVFCLMHWPCSTTLLTVKKETGSIRYTILCAVVPTVIGLVVCMAINAAAHIFS